MAAQDAIMLVFVEYLLRAHVSGVITIEVEFFPIHWDSIILDKQQFLLDFSILFLFFGFVLQKKFFFT